MTAPAITVKSAPNVSAARVNPSQTGVMAIVGDTPWGLVQKPTVSTTFSAWIANHAPGFLRSSMTVSQVRTYLAVDRFFNEGGESVVTVRAHTMANSVDPDSAATGVKASGDLSRSVENAAAPSVTGERSGPFTVSAGHQMVVRLDEGEVGEQDITIYNATQTLGTFGAAKDFSSVGNILYLVINGALQELEFTAADVSNIAAVTVADFIAAFNVKMAALGFFSRMESIASGGDWRLNHADPSMAFSTGVDALTATILGAVSAPEVSIMILDIGADSVDLTTDTGTTTSLDIVFDIDRGAGAEEVTINVVAADFAGGTGTALITEFVTAAQAQSFTTGIRVFSTGAGATRKLVLVVDETTPGAPADNQFDVAASTATFDDASLDLDVVTGDTGTVSKGAPATLSAAAAETLFDLYLGAEAEASVESGSLIKITHASSGSSRNIRVISGGNSFASAFGFAGTLETGTDNVAGVVALDIAGKFEGTLGNAISCTVRQPVVEEPTKFDLEVAVDGTIQFTLAGLEMDAVSLADANAKQNLVDLSINVINASSVIPDVGSTVTLTGGTEGDALTEAWYIGTRANKRGNFALLDTEDREFPDMLACVDYLAGESTEGTLVQSSGCLFVQLEEMKERTQFYTSWDTGMSIDAHISILKANAEMTLGDLVVNTYGGIVVTNPQRLSGGATGAEPTLTIPATPILMGKVSSGDRSSNGGIHRAAAGIQDNRGVLNGALSVEILLGKQRPETADPRNRNRLASFRSVFLVDEGQVVIGDVQVSGTSGNYESIPARRGHSLLFKNIREVLKSIQFRTVNDETIRSAHKLVEALCQQMLELDGFASDSAPDAFKVDTGSGVNTDASRAEGRIRVRLSTAPVKPGRFIDVDISNLD